MLGINIDQNKYEFDRENGDEESMDVHGATCRCQSQSWADTYRPMRVVHRLLQFVFTMGMFFILISIMDFSTGQMLSNILMICMLVIIGGSAIVALVDLCGCNMIQVRMRIQIPALRRKANTNYLENRADNRYGMVPFIGPIMSGLCAFLNQPPLVRQGRLLNWDSYLANFVTYGAFVGVMLYYEKGLSAGAIVLLLVVILLAVYDVVQDVREALNFSFGVRFFDNCKRVEKRQGPAQVQVAPARNVVAAADTAKQK